MCRATCLSSQLTQVCTYTDGEGVRLEVTAAVDKVFQGGTMFRSIFGRKSTPAEQPALLQESQQGDFVVFESPAVYELPQADVDPLVNMKTQRSPPPTSKPHGIDGVPFQLNACLTQSGTIAGDVDALLCRLRCMGDLSWTEYDYSVERRILQDYA